MSILITRLSIIASVIFGLLFLQEKFDHIQSRETLAKLLQQQTLTKDISTKAVVTATKKLKAKDHSVSHEKGIATENIKSAPLRHNLIFSAMLEGTLELFKPEKSIFPDIFSEIETVTETDDTLSSQYWDLVNEKDQGLRFVDELAQLVELDKQQKRELLESYKKSTSYEEREELLNQIIGEDKTKQYQEIKQEYLSYNRERYRDEQSIILKRRLGLNEEQTEALVSTFERMAYIDPDSITDEPKSIEEELKGVLPDDKIKDLIKCQEEYLYNACQYWSWYVAR